MNEKSFRVRTNCKPGSMISNLQSCPHLWTPFHINNGTRIVSIKPLCAKHAGNKACVQVYFNWFRQLSFDIVYL